MKKKIFILSAVIIFSANLAFAHPGRTDSSGCHTCKTNCEKYGLSYGEYHCHDGSSSSNANSNSGSTYSSNYKDALVETKKSSDTSLELIKIDNDKIEIDNEMSYTTDKENITLSVVATDSKAKLDYDEHIELNVGENEIAIKVTAEDGKRKTYVIKVVCKQNEAISINENELPVMSGNLEETTESNLTLGDVVITGGACGLGYVGYKKHKAKKENKN